ncbi:MAG: pectate lyase [Prevotellaceae bacterium]|jgi:pectate lyase|nr:pectate lyase [Prevotellaceae bacterium]
MRNTWFFKIAFLLFAFANTTAQTVTFTGQTGWLESACVTWLPVAEADSYNVYYSGAGISNRQIDTQLIRSYGSYMRADLLGLAAGTYTVTVKPVIDDIEDTGATSQPLTVLSHDRSGFAHSPASTRGTASGAYNDDGTLKPDAITLYITSQNANTVTLTVKVSDSKTETRTGIADILNAREKGYETTPMAVRIIGKLNASDVNGLDSDNALVIKGKNNFDVQNITIEGVGNDATCYGLGLKISRCSNLEVRNLGFMKFPEDGIEVTSTGRNCNIWIHNCDFFYGVNNGGDKDKGDGSLDCKEADFCTFSYNHFWDSGKCNLLGNGNEIPGNITYHHNWYDHSDSRHPRVRFHTVHVYNNYYDGNSKYGIGSTEKSSIFAESNFFRSCKKPMMISKQGTDIAGGSGGTFSGDDGGIIKAYNNHLEGTYTFAPYSATNTVEFDAVVAATREEQIPSSISAKQGGGTYNNFDTEATMYPYTADSPQDAKTKVMQYAGRMEGGDFQWTFNTSEDNNYGIITALSDAINSYTSQLVSIQDENNDNGDGGDNGDTDIEGGGLCDLMNSSRSVFSITGNSSDSKGSVTYNGTVYNCCLKMESGTNISFTAIEASTLTLVFGGSTSANGKNVKIDGVNHTIDATQILTSQLEAGAHSITKGDAINLFYMSLVPDVVTENIGNTFDKTAVKIIYYNISGQKINNFTANQLIIRETIFSDGTIQREKIILKK